MFFLLDSTRINKIKSRLLYYFVSAYLFFRPVSYRTKKCSDLSDMEYENCSRLFSNHYGVYNENAPREKRYKRIQMSSRLYKKHYSKLSNAYVTLAFSGKLLLGQAFFISDDVEAKGRCTWVTQLVVHGLFRRRTIASKLLQSAWGFSDDCAWGLATVNPMTIKVLEDATFRKTDLSFIKQEEDTIRTLQKKVPFASDKVIIIDDKVSNIDSGFYPIIEHANKPDFQYYKSVLGDIPSGKEWIAFVFNEQPLNYERNKWDSFMKFQENQLIESYSRMNMTTHKWTAGTKEEVEYILDFLSNNMQSAISSDTRVLDLGCGTGRHLNTLLRIQKVKRAVGIDFSYANIQKARSGTSGMQNAPIYKVHDARKYRSIMPYDVVFCLYDVIGSYRNDRDNDKLIDSVKRNLKRGGHAFISVMNMEYTSHVAIHKESLSKNPDALLALKPSENMAKTGDVFKPEFFMINTDDGLVYRKEQFRDKQGRDAEFLIADKRYTKDEMTGKLEKHGLKVIDSRYVNAKQWSIEHGPTEAKEILFVVSK